MDLLIITALYPPAVGGAATYFGDVVPRLAQHEGIDHLTVLAECMAGQPRESADGGLRLLRWLPRRVSGPRRAWLGHAATYVLTQAWFAARLPALVQREDIDMIQFHTRYRGRLFYSALQRSGVPVIADLRDKMTDPARLAGVADRLLCCGEGVQRFAVEGGFPAERAALVPIPFTPPQAPSSAQVAAARQRYGLGEGPYLLFLGDITYSKGVYELLEAYREWRSEHPRVRLVYAGANREGERFLNQVEQAPGAHCVGHVPHQDALALIRGAEILALPSRSEGLPRVILEAVALGTKVICPPGIPEFDEHLSAFVLPEVSPECLHERLAEVWREEVPRRYPFGEHRLDRVIEGLKNIYGEMA